MSYREPYVPNHAGYDFAAASSMTPVDINDAWGDVTRGERENDRARERALNKQWAKENAKAKKGELSAPRSEYVAKTLHEDWFKDHDKKVADEYIQKKMLETGLSKRDLMLTFPTLYYASLGLEPEPILNKPSFSGSMAGRGGMWDETARDTVTTRDGKIISVKDAYGLRGSAW